MGVNSAGEIERTPIKKSHGSQREQWQALCKMPCGLTAECNGAVTPDVQINAVGFVQDALRADRETEWSCHSLGCYTLLNELSIFDVSLLL